MVEHLAVNEVVPGSSPGFGVRYISKIFVLTETALFQSYCFSAW